MNILITGGTGLLGGRLIKFFSKTANVKSVSRKKNKKFLYINWKDSKSIARICKNIDIIIHAAGPSLKDCIKSPKNAIKYYSTITEKFIKSASVSKVKLFIFLSSVKVYDNKNINISENYKSFSDHPYAKANLMGEKKVLEINKKDKMKRVVLRLSNCFGYPLEKNSKCWHLAINSMCKNAIIKKKIILKTDGEQYLDFISIAELCKVIKLIIKKKTLIKKNIINITSGKPIKILDMANLIKLRYQNMFGKKVVIIKSKKKEISNFCNFKNNFLKKNNLNISNKPINEIDKLLKFCKKNFVFKY